MKKIDDFINEQLDVSQLMDAKEMTEIQGGCYEGFWSCSGGWNNWDFECNNGMWGCRHGLEGCESSSGIICSDSLWRTRCSSSMSKEGGSLPEIR